MAVSLELEGVQCPRCADTDLRTSSQDALILQKLHVLHANRGIRAQLPQVQAAAEDSEDD